MPLEVAATAVAPAPATAPSPAPTAARAPWRLLLLLGLCAFALRAVRLSADPPATMPEATPMDEGLWADAARGKLFFDDWWADDTGNAILIAPMHSVVQYGVYSLFGVGLWQTRLPSAIASALLCVVLGLVAHRALGPRGLLLTGALLACSPLLDQHGRMGLLESEQMFWIACAFALLFARQPPLRRGALAGVFMACAFATKPNALAIGALPLAFAFALDWRAAARAREPAAHRDHLRAGSAAVAGGLLALLPFLVFVWLPHLPQWRQAAEAEMGNDHWTLGGQLLRLGLFLDRESRPGEHRMWAPLRHAPAIALGAWLWAVGRRGRAALPGERALAAWALATLFLVETHYMHVGRRQLLALPPLAVLAACHLRAGRTNAPAAPAAPRWLGRYGDWLLLTLPVFAAVKPSVCNLAPLLGDDAVAGRYVDGLLFFAPWLVVPFLLARRFDPARWRARLCALSPALLLLLFVADAARLAVFRNDGDSILRAQDALRGTVADGDTVLGQNATLLFLDRRVKTPRRVLASADFATPRPNPDVFERLRPRWLLDYRGSVAPEMGDLTRRCFVPARQAAYLKEPDGSWRYELQLWERR